MKNEDKELCIAKLVELRRWIDFIREMKGDNGRHILTRTRQEQIEQLIIDVEETLQRDNQ